MGANGMGGLVVPAVFERIPQVTLEVMYGELDGTFPNHMPDPLKPSNLVDLIAKVKEHAREWIVGEPLNPEVRVGALISKGHFDKVCRYLKMAAAEKLLSGDPKVFTEAVITGDGSKYPMLPGLKERKPTDYMIGENFGKGR